MRPPAFASAFTTQSTNNLSPSVNQVNHNLSPRHHPTCFLMTTASTQCFSSCWRFFVTESYLGGMNLYVQEFGVKKTHDEFNADLNMRAQFNMFVQFIIVRYANEPTVMAWELANDFCCNSSVGASPSCNTNTTASAPPTTVEQPLYQFSPSPPAAAPSRDQPLSSSPIQTRFRPVLAPESSPVSTLLGASSPRFASLPIGTRIEVSAASFQTAHKLGMLISQGTRCSALVVDYGTNHAIGNSFRVRVSFLSAYYHFFTSDSMRSCVCVGIGGPRPRRPI